MPFGSFRVVADKPSDGKRSHPSLAPCPVHFELSRRASRIISLFHISYITAIYTLYPNNHQAGMRLPNRPASTSLITTRQSASTKPLYVTGRDEHRASESPVGREELDLVDIVIGSK